jgi:hypothetical protein
LNFLWKAPIYHIIIIIIIIMSLYSLLPLEKKTESCCKLLLFKGRDTERERERVLMQALQGKLFQNRRVSGYVSYLITGLYPSLVSRTAQRWSKVQRWFPGAITVILKNLRTGHIIIHKPAGSMLVIS